MADQKPNPFKAMMAARPNAPLVEDEPVEEQPKQPEPTHKRSTGKKTTSTSRSATYKPKSEAVKTPAQEPEPENKKTSEPVKRGRGRPPGGKRADDKWIPRTYYVERNNDIDCEIELARLRAHGIELDKSDLVNALLGAWVKFQRGENKKIQLDEISPRQKSKKVNS
jgi:hypothetical protein